MSNLVLTINLVFDSKIPTQPLHVPLMDDDDEWLAHHYEEYHDACIDLAKAIKSIKGNNN